MTSHPPYDIAGSSFRPLSNIPHCCLNKVGPCPSPEVVVHPLRSTKHYAWYAITAPTTTLEMPVKQRVFSLKTLKSFLSGYNKSLG